MNALIQESAEADRIVSSKPRRARDMRQELEEHLASVIESGEHLASVMDSVELLQVMESLTRGIVGLQNWAIVSGRTGDRLEHWRGAVTAVRRSRITKSYKEEQVSGNNVVFIDSQQEGEIVARIGLWSDLRKYTIGQ